RPSKPPKASESRQKLVLAISCRLLDPRPMIREPKPQCRWAAVSENVARWRNRPWLRQGVSRYDHLLISGMGRLKFLLLIAVVTIITGLGLCFFRKRRD